MSKRLDWSVDGPDATIEAETEAGAGRQRGSRPVESIRSRGTTVRHYVDEETTVEQTRDRDDISPFDPAGVTV